MRIAAILIIFVFADCLADERGVGSNVAVGNQHSGLVGWWEFDESVDSLTPDSSGNGNPATIHNGQLGEGRRGSALVMDGGNDGIVTVPMSDSLRSARDGITVMAWAYRTAENNVAVLAHNYQAMFFGFHGPEFKWMLRGEGKKPVRCQSGPDHAAALNQWIHLAATYDTRTLRLYADGNEVCSKPYESQLNLTEKPITISGYLTETGAIVDEITGRIDDVRIYNRAMPGEEIHAHWQKDLGSQK